MLVKKLEKLRKIIKGKKSVVVAFSGGVDSSVLAGISKEVLGNNAIAVTLDSPTIPKDELKEAKKIARLIGIRHVFLKGEELKNKNFLKNPTDRCYYCKKELLKVARKFAKNEGIKNILEGTNASELKGHRPGMRAIVEGKASSPLAEAGITKDEVRKIAKKLGLPNFDKPSTACIASRIPYKEAITVERLRTIEKCEKFLKNLNVKQVRVRHHGDTARIEVMPSDFKKILNSKEKIIKSFSKLGFKHITLDLSGYRTGSMNL